MIETVRLSEHARGQLVGLKRRTGIKNWNVLCRWALAVALADPSTPLVRDIVTDSNVEMSWKTFAGTYGGVWLALVKQRCVAEGNAPDDPAALTRTLIVHLHRGIGFLAGRSDLRDVVGLIGLALGADEVA